MAVAVHLWKRAGADNRRLARLAVELGLDLGADASLLGGNARLLRRLLLAPLPVSRLNLGAATCRFARYTGWLRGDRDTTRSTLCRRGGIHLRRTLKHGLADGHLPRALVVGN